MAIPADRSLYEPLEYNNWRSKHWDTIPFVPEFSSLYPAVDAQLQARPPGTVVVEHEYPDIDYAAAFASFYSHAFRPFAKACTRFLFFEKPFTDVTAIGNKALTGRFLGFIVLWPTDPPVIGRSVLEFPRTARREELRVEAPYKVHVFGQELEITSAMFASKDHGVSACASITTWLATDLMHCKFDLPTTSSTEITLLATGNDPKYGPPMPQTGGLDTSQIIRALVQLDYSPWVYPYYADDGGRQTN